LDWIRVFYANLLNDNSTFTENQGELTYCANLRWNR